MMQNIEYIVAYNHYISMFCPSSAIQNPNIFSLVLHKKQ